MRIATCDPLRASKPASFISSAACWLAVREPVRSLTWEVSGGTGCRLCASAVRHTPTSATAQKAGALILSPGPVHTHFVAAPGAGAGAVPLGGVLVPKSTVGAVAICDSFSTVKFGFKDRSKSFAVRLVGNERTVTLYC